MSRTSEGEIPVEGSTAGLHTATAELGGKGANLVRLRDSGFPVPEFVVVPVGEYHEFVAAHGLEEVIARHLHEQDTEAASAAIRAAFRQPMTDDQRDRLTDLIGDLVDRPVAVRSSATAEDLPEASFAGQQDTFLGVQGSGDVLAAIVECWSSLWTARAMSYRARNDIAHAGLGLAVVVQRQVEAEVSGVVFTADPLTGRRDRLVVDAVAGLGEQLVSGQVTPDHYEVEHGRVVDRTVQGDVAVLGDAVVVELAGLCRRVADAFGSPQDIEFTWADEAFALVQSRAITNLFPAPGGPADAIHISFGAIQGMLAPITPLGRDLLAGFAAGAAQVFGRTVDPRKNVFVREAGERLWIRVDRLLTGPARPLVLRLLPIGDPVAAAILASLAGDPQNSVRRDPTALAAALRMAGHALLPRIPRVARNLRDPDRARAEFIRVADDLVAAVEAEFASAAARPDARARLQSRLGVVTGRVSTSLSVLFAHFLPVMGPSVLMLARLRALAARTGLPDADALALSIVRSLPDNVTTRMDLALYDAARRIAADPDSRAAFAAEPAAIATRYGAVALPSVATEALAGFLGEYGMRGVAEIDLGVPRWREDPEQVIATIRSYLDGPDHAAAHAEGARAAEDAIDRLAAALPRRDAAQVRFLAGRIRRLFGLRETPKFTLVRVLGLVREALLASGGDLAAAGRLDRPDDVMFLHLDELGAAFDVDHHGLVAERRALRERETRRGRVPDVLLGDGRAYWSAPGADADTADVVGTGVSPGVVTAPVRVVDDPARAGLQPGEILVCRGTDPAWTPLFLIAGGLVTEVGGLMTHGSVVAREYGLPAVVGVPEATRLLTTGDVVTLDGSTGAIRHDEGEHTPGRP